MPQACRAIRLASGGPGPEARVPVVLLLVLWLAASSSAALPARAQATGGAGDGEPPRVIGTGLRGPGRSPAGQAKAVPVLDPQAHHFLFLVETSASLRRVMAPVRAAVFESLANGAQRGMRRGDTFAVWTAGRRLDTNGLPPRVWAPELSRAAALQALEFLDRRRFPGQGQLAATLTEVARLASFRPTLTVFLLTADAEPIRGTPFDQEVNRALKRQQADPGSGTRAHVITLEARDGKFVMWGVGTTSEPLEAPAFPATPANVPVVANPSPGPVTVRDLPRTEVPSVLPNLPADPKRPPEPVPQPAPAAPAQPVPAATTEPAITLPTQTPNAAAPAGALAATPAWEPKEKPPTEPAAAPPAASPGASSPPVEVSVRTTNPPAAAPPPSSPPQAGPVPAEPSPPSPSGQVPSTNEPGPTSQASAPVPGRPRAASAPPTPIALTTPPTTSFTWPLLALGAGLLLLGTFWFHRLLRPAGAGPPRSLISQSLERESGPDQPPERP